MHIAVAKFSHELWHLASWKELNFIFLFATWLPIQDAFHQTHGQIKNVLKETNAEFKAYKANLESLQSEVKRRRRKIDNLRKAAQPQERIDEESGKLKAAEDKLDAQLEGKWMLEMRDLMRQPEKMKMSKNTLTS